MVMVDKKDHVFAKMRPGTIIRLVIGIVCLSGLVAVFIFQDFNVASRIDPGSSRLEKFLINRSIRFILNDTLAIGLIFAIFRERKFVVFSVWVQLAGMFVFLIPYFILKIYMPSYDGPLISFLHRLILNPTLLLLLIPAFYYQKRLDQNSI
jgi:exosortase F-associated protein